MWTQLPRPTPLILLGRKCQYHLHLRKDLNEERMKVVGGKRAGSWGVAGPPYDGRRPFYLGALAAPSTAVESSQIQAKPETCSTHKNDIT